MDVADMGRLPEARAKPSPRALEERAQAALRYVSHTRDPGAPLLRADLHLPARTCWGGRVGALTVALERPLKRGCLLPRHW